MTASTFDALTAARELEAAGAERHLAEAIAKMGRDAAGAGRDDLATKADLDAGLASVRGDLAALEARMYRYLLIHGGAVVAILTALRFLPI